MNKKILIKCGTTKNIQNFREIKAEVSLSRCRSQTLFHLSDLSGPLSPRLTQSESSLTVLLAGAEESTEKKEEAVKKAAQPSEEESTEDVKVLCLTSKKLLNKYEIFVQACVPDSSVAEESGEAGSAGPDNQEDVEQLSSGSVDEELLEEGEDDITETKSDDATATEDSTKVNRVGIRQPKY